MSKHLYEEIDELHRVLERLNDRIAALEAENERLRKALILAEEQIVGLYNGIAPSARHEGSNAFADIDPIVEHIRQTLEAKP